MVAGQNLLTGVGCFEKTNEAFAVFHAVNQVVRQHIQKDQAKLIPAHIEEEL